MTLDRRQFLQLSTTALRSAILMPDLLSAADKPELYQRSLVIDGLGFPGSMNSQEDEGLTAPEIDDLAQSGLTALNLTVGEVGTMAPLQSFEKIVRDVTRWDSEIARHGEILTRVRSAQDISLAKAAAKTGLIYGLQDGVAFEDDIGRLEALHHVGTLTLDLQDSSHGQ